LPAHQQFKRFSCAGCIAPGKFRILSGSFTSDYKDWAEGTQKRIVTIDVAVSGGALEGLLRNVQWGSDSVVATMGYEGDVVKTAGFKQRKRILVATSWSGSQFINFYTRGNASSF